MRIVIPGGSGKVGTVLARAFHRVGHDVVVLSRAPKVAPWRVLAWDGKTISDWAKHIDGADVVINLAGRSVDCRYTQANRESPIPTLDAYLAPTLPWLSAILVPAGSIFNERI